MQWKRAREASFLQRQICEGFFPTVEKELCTTSSSSTATSASTTTSTSTTNHHHKSPILRVHSVDVLNQQCFLQASITTEGIHLFLQVECRHRQFAFNSTCASRSVCLWYLNITSLISALGLTNLSLCKVRVFLMNFSCKIFNFLSGNSDKLFDQCLCNIVIFVVFC